MRDNENDFDEDDFIDDMIAYHIITEEEERGGGGRRPGSGGGCLSWIFMILAVMFVIAFFGQCTGCIK